MPTELTYFLVNMSEWMGAVAVAWLFSILPLLQQHPKLGFKYPRREGIMALATFLLISVGVFFYFARFQPEFPSPLIPHPAPIAALSQALVAALIALLPVVVALLARAQPPKSAGWDTKLLRPGLQIGLAAGLLTIFLRGKVMPVLTGFDQAGILALVTALGVALAEETVFRGYIQLRLSSWLGDWPGLVASAALFTLWHAAGWINHLAGSEILLLAALTFIQGLVLGWIMRKCRTVLAPAIYRAVSIWLFYL